MKKTEKFFQNLDILGHKVTHSFEEAVKVAQQKIDLVRGEIQRREEEEKKGQITMDEMKDEVTVSNETSSLMSDTDNPINDNVSNNNNNN